MSLRPIKQFLLFTMTVVAIATNAETQTTAIEMMTKACDHYKDLKAVQLRALVSMDEDDEGFKTQQNFIVDVKAQVPNKLFVRRQGDRLASVFFDGKTLSAIDDETLQYAQASIVGNFPELLVASERLRVPTPLLDFLAPASCREALNRVKEGRILEALTIDGQAVQHLAFRNEADQIDWQAWLKKDGDGFAIKRIVITSTDIADKPQTQFTIVSESLNPQVDEKEFVFTAPVDAVKVDFLAALDQQSIVPMIYARAPARGVARRTARRTTRRYIARLPAGCPYRGGYYVCGGYRYMAAIENGVTVYVIVD